MYSQHPNLFNDTVKRDCPRHAFLLDFAEAISTLYKEGYQIIVAGDLNEHINIKKVKSYLAKIGLREIITEKHSKKGSSTTRRN